MSGRPSHGRFGLGCFERHLLIPQCDCRIDTSCAASGQPASHNGHSREKCAHAGKSAQGAEINVAGRFWRANLGGYTFIDATYQDPEIPDGTYYLGPSTSPGYGVLNLNGEL